MQVNIFLSLFFLTTFSCGSAQGEDPPETVDNKLLTADVKRLPSAEESHVPEDGDLVNVEEIVRELTEERAKNRNLNQTISDILQEMENMKRDISVNQLTMELLSNDVDDLTEDVTAVQDDVVAMAKDVDRNSANITNMAEDVENNSVLITNVTEDVLSLFSADEQQAAQIKLLATRGTWCGYKYTWDSGGTINHYGHLTFSDSNMDINGTPLDINTGIFTVPLTGFWKVTYSMESVVNSYRGNSAMLYNNGDMVRGSEHNTSSESGVVRSTGGRELIMELSQGENIDLRTYQMDGKYYHVNFCAAYIPKM